MSTLKKFGKLFLDRLSEHVGCAVLRGDSAILLPSSASVQNKVTLRCVKEKDDPDLVHTEVRFIVGMSEVEALWPTYSGRPGVPWFTCARQIRDVAYPGYGLPVWGFSLSMRGTEALDRAVQTLGPVIEEKLIPLARTCLDADGVLDAISNGSISAQQFDIALLLALSGRNDDALVKIGEGKAFFGDPENGFEPGGIMWTMFDSLEKEILSTGTIASGGSRGQGTVPRYH